jgi:DNA-binding YbaB/EbfC family protein
MMGGNPMKMLRQVQEMQAKMQKVQAELEGETVEATAGGGAVTAVATGAQKLVSVTIDPDLASDVEMLQDLVVAAVNEALDRSRELAAKRMGSLAGGLGLPPGLLG